MNDSSSRLYSHPTWAFELPAGSRPFRRFRVQRRASRSSSCLGSGNCSGFEGTSALRTPRNRATASRSASTQASASRTHTRSRKFGSGGCLLPIHPFTRETGQTCRSRSVKSTTGTPFFAMALYLSACARSLPNPRPSSARKMVRSGCSRISRLPRASPTASSAANNSLGAIIAQIRKASPQPLSAWSREAAKPPPENQISA